MFSISKRVSLSNWNIKSNVGVQILITIYEKYLLTKNPCSSERGFFYPSRRRQAFGLAYHRRTTCGAYHQPLWGLYLITRQRASYLRIDDIPQQVADDIQGYALICLRK